MEKDIRLIRVTQPESEDRLLQEIYEDSFPSNERRDWYDLMSLCRLQDFKLMRIMAENELCGLMTIWNMGNFLFIEHFAIHAAMRGKGIGKQVIEQQIAESTLPLILEVELPETDLALRRIAFYNRMGFVVCEGSYFQPPYSVNYENLNMLLMCYSATKDQFYVHQFQEKIHRKVYNIGH